MSDVVANAILENPAEGGGGATASINLHSFYGEELYRVDNQRRTQFPTIWKQYQRQPFMLLLWDLEEEPGKFTIHLKAMPQAKFDRMLQRLSRIGLGNAEGSKLRRRLLPNSRGLQVDPIGRICLPQNYAEKARIQKAAVFAGVGDYFEIWNPEAYQARHLSESDDVKQALGTYLSDEI